MMKEPNLSHWTQREDAENKMHTNENQTPGRERVNENQVITKVRRKEQQVL